MNLIFGLRLRYFNGLFICKKELFKNVKLISKGFAIYAEAKVKLIRNGCSYFEIPFVHTGRVCGQSKAVNLKSVLYTIETIILLVRDIYLTKVQLADD